MKIDINLRSESGLIKVPIKMLEHVQNLVRIKMLSYADQSTDDNDHSDVHKLIMQLFDEYQLKPVDMNGAFMPTETNIDTSGLPKGYYKFSSRHDRTLIIALDNIKEGSNAYFTGPNKLYICTSPLRKILYSKFTVHLRDLKTYFEELDTTVYHELTHYIQFTFLHPSNKSVKEHYDSHSPDFTLDDYLTSRIEFDPQIKSEFAKFLRYLKSKGFPNSDHYDWPNISSCIRTFVYAIPKTDELFNHSLKQSPFFEALKRVEPKAYKKAVRIFCNEIYKLVPPNKRKYWHLNW